MAVLGKVGQNEDRNFMQKIADANRTTIRRPSTNKGVTIFRPLPEIAPDGSIRPMVVAETPAGPDFSAVMVEDLATGTGLEQKFTGIVRPSDRPDMDEVEFPFTQMFVRLKGMVKHKKFDGCEHLKEQINGLFDQDARKSLLQRPRTYGLVQCVLHTFNDTVLPKPLPYQTLALSSTAVQGLCELLTESHKKGLDLFSPEGGHYIKIYPEKQRVGDMYFFSAQLESAAPLKPETCRKLWVPWGEMLTRYTYEQHVRSVIECFGRELAEIGLGRRAVARALGESEPTPASVAAQSAPAGTHVLDEDDLPASQIAQQVQKIQPELKPSVGLDDDLLSVDPKAAAVNLGEEGDDDAAPLSGPAAPDPSDPEAMMRHYAKLMEQQTK